MGSPAFSASNLTDALFSQLCGGLWRIRSYKHSGSMSATAEIMFERAEEQRRRIQVV